MRDKKWRFAALLSRNHDQVICYGAARYGPIPSCDHAYRLNSWAFHSITNLNESVTI